MSDFIKNCLRTEALPPSGITLRQGRLLHSGMGMATESGEFLDQLKKHVFYGAPLDETNLKEEIGDQLWYIALALHELDSDFDTEMERVLAKLRTRYPSKFEANAALMRDIDAERETLENFKRC